MDARDLAFLLSLGAIPLACVDGESGSDGATTTSSASSATSDAAGTAGSATTGETVGTDATSDATATTSSATMGSATGGSACGSGEGGEACEAYWEHFVECFPRYTGSLEGLVALCEGQVHGLHVFQGAACRDARVTHLHCLGDAPCDALKADPPPCEAEEAAMESACLYDPGGVCVAYGERETRCDPQTGADDAAHTCQIYVNSNVYTYGCLCGEAWEDYYVCLTELPCGEVEPCDSKYPLCGR